MVFVPKELYRPTDAEVAAYGHSRRDFLKTGLLASSALLAGCVPPENTQSTPTPTPTPSAKVDIGGKVVNRMNGEPLNGLNVELTGISGNAYGSKPLTTTVNGRYEFAGLTPGTYKVSISGNSIVPHLTESFDATASGEYPFSVIEKGSYMDIGGQKVYWDDRFANFFKWFARDRRPGYEGLITKWDNAALPTEIYITEGGLSDEAMEVFLPILKNINNRNTNPCSGQQLQPLPINSGPAVPQDFKDKSITITFNGNHSTGKKYSGQATIAARVYLLQSYYEVGGQLYNDRREMERTTGHEFYHAFCAEDILTSDNGYGGGVIDGSALYPSPQEQCASRLAVFMCPGNKEPDVNPRYFRYAPA